MGKVFAAGEFSLVGVSNKPNTFIASMTSGHYGIDIGGLMQWTKVKITPWL